MGNSPDIVFLHYRELVIEKGAKAWLATTPEAAKQVRDNIEREGAPKKTVFPSTAAAYRSDVIPQQRGRSRCSGPPRFAVQSTPPG